LDCAHLRQHVEFEGPEPVVRRGGDDWSRRIFDGLRRCITQDVDRPEARGRRTASAWSDAATSVESTGRLKRTVAAPRRGRGFLDHARARLQGRCRLPPRACPLRAARKARPRPNTASPADDDRDASVESRSIHGAATTPLARVTPLREVVRRAARRPHPRRCRVGKRGGIDSRAVRQRTGSCRGAFQPL